MVGRAVLVGVSLLGLGGLGATFAACSDRAGIPAAVTGFTGQQGGTGVGGDAPDAALAEGGAQPGVDAGGPPGSDASVDSGADAAPSASTFTSIYANIVSKQCGPTCHLQATGATGGLRMDTKAQAYANLVNIDVQSPCGNALKRVAPFEPAKSKLYIKIGAPSATILNCGNRMPNPGTVGLPNADVIAISDCIAAGALNN